MLLVLPDPVLPHLAAVPILGNFDQHVAASPICLTISPAGPLVCSLQGKLIIDAYSHAAAVQTWLQASFSATAALAVSDTA